MSALILRGWAHVPTRQRSPLVQLVSWLSASPQQGCHGCVQTVCAIFGMGSTAVTKRLLFNIMPPNPSVKHGRPVSSASRGLRVAGYLDTLERNVTLARTP
jgi:hypothetical protein